LHSISCVGSSVVTLVISLLAALDLLHTCRF